MDKVIIKKYPRKTVNVEMPDGKIHKAKINNYDDIVTVSKTINKSKHRLFGKIVNGKFVEI